MSTASGLCRRDSTVESSEKGLEIKYTALKITIELKMTEDLWPQTSWKPTKGVQASSKTAL